MSKQLYANNARGKLNAGITNVATTMTLQAGQGALFPNPTNGEWYLSTLVDGSGNKEIVKVTQRTGDVINTMVRGQEGTASIAFNANDKVECRPTKGTMDSLQQIVLLDTITGSVTLTKYDVWKTKNITAAALTVIDLPDSAVCADGDFIDFKSSTEVSVVIRPQGADLLDGDGLATPYRLPSFCSVRAIRASAGTWILLGRSAVEVGDVVPSFNGTLKKGHIWPNGVDANRVSKGGLFAVYGTTYGIGDGATTFGIPNAQGRGMVGQETMGGATTPDARQKTTNLSTTSGLVAAVLASATDIEKGMYVYGPNVAAGTKISVIAGLNVTLSIAATGTANVAHRFSWLAQDPQTIGSRGGKQGPQVHNHTGTAAGSGTGTADVNRNFFGGGGGPSLTKVAEGVEGPQTIPVAVNVTVTIPNDGAGDAGNLPPEIVGTMMIKT